MEKADRLAMEKMAEDIEELKRLVKHLDGRMEVAPAALWWAMSDRDKKTRDLGRLFLKQQEKLHLLNHRLALWAKAVEQNVDVLDRHGAILENLTTIAQSQSNRISATHQRIDLLRMELGLAGVSRKHSEELSPLIVTEEETTTTENLAQRFLHWLRTSTKR